MDPWGHSERGPGQKGDMNFWRSGPGVHEPQAGHQPQDVPMELLRAAPRSPPCRPGRTEAWVVHTPSTWQASFTWNAGFTLLCMDRAACSPALMAAFLGCPGRWAGRGAGIRSLA